MEQLLSYSYLSMQQAAARSRSSCRSQSVPGGRLPERNLTSADRSALRRQALIPPNHLDTYSLELYSWRFEELAGCKKMEGWPDRPRRRTFTITRQTRIWLLDFWNEKERQSWWLCNHHLNLLIFHSFLVLLLALSADLLHWFDQCLWHWMSK